MNSNTALITANCDVRVTVGNRQDVLRAFLRSTGYYSDEEPLRTVYFDGGDSDTATFLHRDRTLHLLLTNGSP
ncbi:hypothetical protein [Streptomyces erythrochromogenes]|uniref:hypothetical protein n=1 Tax=Streptomyces erythrochromogenes TaxID=285574 RepID=UPI003824BA34